MTGVPLNAISWSLGAAALYVFALRSRSSYRLTKNPVARMYYAIGLAFGTSLFFYGVPGLFTTDTHTLRYTYFLADLFAQITLQAGLWLLWFLGLRNRVRLDHLYLLTIPYSAVLMTLQALTSRVTISQSPYLIVYTDKPAVLVMKSIIYMAVSLPIGYFLLRQVPLQTSLKSKLKSFMAGMTFIVISLAATSNNIFDKGADTPGSCAVVIVFFSIFLLVQLLNPSITQPGR